MTDDPIREDYAMERALERSAGASASGTVIMARSSKPPGSFISRETSVAKADRAIDSLNARACVRASRVPGALVKRCTSGLSHVELPLGF